MKRIGVLTSGGDSPGMNAAIRAVVRGCYNRDVEVVGIRRGFQGLIDDDIEPLSTDSVSRIINAGGTMLRTARCKEFYEPEGRSRGAETLKRHGIDGLVVIGGDGSYHGAHFLEEEHGIKCVGLPGTIDNDIGGTDYTIGFHTALNTAMEAIDKLHDTAESHERIFFVEVMGRDSGYIGMMAGIAGGAEHVLTPEDPTDLDLLSLELEQSRNRGNMNQIVIVSEGDDAGNAYQIAEYVKKRTGIEDIRVTVLGHIQRGGVPSAFDRILASRLGVHGVETLLSGKSGVMIGVRAEEIVTPPLSDAWEKSMAFDSSYHTLVQALRMC
jgi:6-phosphofructokinase 1